MLREPTIRAFSQITHPSAKASRHYHDVGLFKLDKMQIPMGNSVAQTVARSIEVRPSPIPQPDDGRNIARPEEVREVLSADNGRAQLNVILAVLAAAGTVFALNQSIIVPALPQLQAAFHTSQDGAVWILTANLLAAAVFTPIVGRLGDTFGKHRVLLLAVLGMGVGTLISAVAGSLTWMLVGRVVAGLGAGVYPVSFAIVRAEFPRERIAGSIGLVSSLLGIGGSLGLLLPGVIIERLGYRWLFWLPFIAIMLTAALIYRFIPPSPAVEASRVHVGAAITMAAGLSLTLVALTRTTVWGWGSSRTLGMLAAGLLFILGWIWIELHARIPLIDMRMMRLRGVWTSNLAAALLGAGMYAWFAVVPAFVETPRSSGYGFGASVTMSGIFMLPTAAGQLLVAPIAGRLHRLIGARKQLLVGSGFALAAFVMLAVAHSAAWQIYVSSSLLGLGLGLALASLANLIVLAVPQHQTGAATGVNTVMRTLGGAVGSQVTATAVAATAVAGGLPHEHGYVLAFTLGAIALTGAIIAGLIVPAPGIARSSAG
jgi:MFS family permease